MGNPSYLDHYPLFRSSDIEFVRDRLFKVYGADRFDGNGENFGAHANYAKLGSIGVAYCSYAGAATLSFPESGIIRQLFSIDGAAAIKTTRASRPIGAWSSIVSGDSRLDLDFAAGYRQLVVRIDAGNLDRLLKSIIGEEGGELRFAEEDPDPALMKIVRRDVFKFAEELDRYGRDYSYLAAAELERSLLVRMLLSHRHNFTDRIYVTPPRANRAVVDIVESYLEAHWDQPMDLEKIAGIANVSVRTIFREFSESGRPSPALFLRQIRLQRAARLLERANPQTSVVSVALKCGFRNIGRFASEYRRLIGELPSETLANARRR